MTRPSQRKQIKIYEDLDGREPFTEWVHSVKDAKTRYRIFARLDRLEQGNLGECEFVGEGVYELKLVFGPGYRVYFGELNETLVVLLCGGSKRSQKKDIKRAKTYWVEYQKRFQ